MADHEPLRTHTPYTIARSDKSPWRRYTIVIGATAFGLLALIVGLIALIGPYGPLPMSLSMTRPPIVQSQRLAFPTIVRSGSYDAFVVGSSTSRTIDPTVLDSHLGTHAANVGINGATQHEQRMMAGLIAHQIRNLRLLVWALDATWCAGEVTAIGHPQQPFSDWLYDDIWWNDLPHFANTRALEAAAALVRFQLGMAKARYPDNGFLIETPAENTYDVTKAHERIYAGVTLAPTNPMGAGTDPIGEQEASYRFPALAWIDQTLSALPASAQRVLVLMPVHVAVLPEAGSAEDGRLRACKRALTDIAKRNNAALMDYRFASDLTRRDDSYWDALHVRREQAGRITREIVDVAGGNGSDSGWYRVLYRPPGSTAPAPVTGAPAPSRP
jgi:hypothetical protein